MRKINKKTPLSNFNGANFKVGCRTWDDFHKNHKQIYEKTRCQILMDEQNQLCGYTEIFINELKSCHIDHYKKRDISPELTFDWNNLIVATKDSAFGAGHKDQKYGIQKSDYDNIFNPVVDEIENYFYYTEWGEVIPKTTIPDDKNEKAQKTINVFNLNHNSLKARRKGLFKMVGSYNGLAKEGILLALEHSGFVSLKNQILE